MGKKNVSKKKKLVITVLAVLAAAVLIVFIGARVYFRLPVRSYYKISQKEFKIPGLTASMVPQGLDLTSDGTFIVGGYQGNNEPSRIYRIDGEKKSTSGFVVLGDTEGSPIKVHAGGIASHGGYCFVTGDDASLLVYDLNDVLKGENGKVIKMLGKISLKFGNDEVIPAWICFTADRMIVGEFYRVPNYLTPDSHIFKGASGEENHAVALCYKLTDSSDKNFGIETQPEEIYSLPGLVQGMAVHDGKVWISQSWGTSISTVSSYDISKSKPETTMKTGDLELPVYVLDSSTKVSSFKAPPMSEEIIFVNGRLYIMNESASNKYIFGKLTGGSWCYSTDVSRI